MNFIHTTAIKLKYVNSQITEKSTRPEDGLQFRGILIATAVEFAMPHAARKHLEKKTKERTKRILGNRKVGFTIPETSFKQRRWHCTVKRDRASLHKCSTIQGIKVLFI